jgi:hypothetical protein
VKLSRIVAAAAAITLLATEAVAHHSFAMFDQEKTVQLSGTIRAFEWTNPHCWIQIYVEGTDGRAVEWSIEGPSPNRLAREGWRSSTLRPGDKVTVTANPLKSGENGGSLVRVTFRDGRVMGLKNTSAEYASGGAPSTAGPSATRPSGTGK